MPRPLSTKQVKSLLTALRSQRELALVGLMLDGGLRPGEALGLKLEDSILLCNWRPTPALEMKDASNCVDCDGTGLVDYQSKASLLAHALAAADFLDKD